MNRQLNTQYLQYFKIKNKKIGHTVLKLSKITPEVDLYRFLSSDKTSSALFTHKKQTKNDTNTGILASLKYTLAG